MLPVLFKRRSGHSLARLSLGTVTMLLMLSLVACAPIAKQDTRVIAPPEHLAQQRHRIEESEANLAALETVDLRLRLDNERLGPIIQESLEGAFAALPGWRSESTRVRFFPGYIALDAVGTLTDASGAAHALDLAGDLILDYQSGQLSWHPAFHHVERANPPEAATPLTAPVNDADLLAEINAALQESLAQNGDGALEIDPMPLGILETGMRLQMPFESVTADSRLLQGLLTTAAVAVLIAPGESTLALDLGFVPGLPDCQSDIDIGRATFAGAVRNREPQDLAGLRADSAATRFFFTDVLETREATSVIHYWLADGRPASLAELDVQPSARWRTWSSRPTEPADVQRWQVLVIEKSSGCILAQRSVTVADAGNRALSGSGISHADGGTGAAGDAALSGALPDNPAYTFDELEAHFLAATSELPLPTPFEGMALIDVTPAFFSAALSEAMYDLRLRSSPEVRSAPLPIRSAMAAFPPDALSCEVRDCSSRRVCTVDFDDCPVRSDTRDCTSCLFRNPLNNRCMREAEDPICIAARDSENLRLEERRQACIADRTRQRDACLAARDREITSCRERASREVSSCAAQANAMKRLRDTGQPVARFEGEARLAGTLDFEFGEFRIEDDLRRIRMRLIVDADLSAEGQLGLVPESDAGSPISCLAALRDQFSARLSLPVWQSGLVTELVAEDGALTADWSGLVQQLIANPALVDEFLDEHPEWLTNCALDVDRARVVELLSGTGTALLQGTLALGLEPEPTRITLLPAYLTAGATTWTGTPVFGSGSIRYLLDQAAPPVSIAR